MRYKPVHILLVEDDPNDVEITLRAFERSGVPCELAVLRDGQEVVEAIRAPPAGLAQPDVILLDLNLPRLNGLEALRAIRASQRLSLTPVVVLSASARREDVQRSYALGASTYIQKPVVFQEFREGLTVLARYWFELAELPQAPFGEVAA
jgi:two-component system response regulator